MYFTKFVITLASLASMASATAMPQSPVESSLDPRDAGSIFERTSFKCPTGMSYCAWTKACSCSPGLSYDSKKGCCTGTAMSGAWPKPSASVYGSVNAKLGAYCACSPYKIVKYDSSHSYCKASVKNVVFLAPIEIDAEIKVYGGATISIGSCSVALKNTCGGLAGLYLESVTDAVALFNSAKFGLSVSAGGVVGGIVGGIVNTVKGLTCWLGLTQCATYDCVSYCTKGCKNYLDVKGSIGGHLKGLVGFCVLPDVLLIVGSAGAVINVVVEHLLCIVGNIIKSLLSTFDCGCN
ncbi:hypothetical protein B0J13DRAFT_30732 [Dactylonectria estremocensis]|uniref:Uncharacterized protein n=1 Tax=Dactylonectria estremocensis TaxID=1079267 RepID=A0A9P9JIT3_9HYPO|nr:hypothetical protein B0J13DRAFT_30732 [Dactylonectria estremocensis]